MEYLAQLRLRDLEADLRSFVAREVDRVSDQEDVRRTVRDEG